METEVKSYLQNLLCGLVRYPEKVQLNVEVNKRNLNITIQVAKEDMRMVVGAQGLTIQAISRIMSVFGGARNFVTFVELLEADGSHRRRHEERQQETA